MNIFGFHDIAPKHTVIIVVAALQILFGLVTIICNEDIFKQLLEKVQNTFLSFFLPISSPFLATGGERGNEDV